MEWSNRYDQSPRKESPTKIRKHLLKYISKKKNEPEWMLSWRLDCYSKWLKMPEPEWANLNIPKIALTYLDVS